MTSDKLAKVENYASSLATVDVFTERQEQMIRDSFMSGATKEDAAMLLEVARTRRLNPLLKQVHFVSRWDKKKNRNVWSVQVSIDGLRAIAERTGKYDGQDEAEFGPPNQAGYPSWAKVRVYRKDWGRPAVGVVYWEEYVQEYDGRPTKFWQTMPRVMLAKCAESVAMRKAFPEDMSGLYTPEEMQQAENQQADERRQPITPHSDGVDSSATTLDEDVFLDLYERMVDAKNMLLHVDSFDKCEELRGVIGNTGRNKQSKLTRDVQAAKAAKQISDEQHKQLSQLWHHVHSQLLNLEKELDPGSASDYLKKDPGDDFDRGAQ